MEASAALRAAAAARAQATQNASSSASEASGGRSNTAPFVDSVGLNEEDLSLISAAQSAVEVT